MLIPIKISDDAETGDYDVVGLTNDRLTFGAWETSAMFTIRTNPDVDNDDETVNLGFGALPSGVATGTPSSATLTIEETNVPPTFVEGAAATRSVTENTTSGNDIGSPVSASDDDMDDLTYSLSGTDDASFRIGHLTGQIRTRASLDFETKNSFKVTVTADDGNGGSDSIDVTITVTDVNEKPAVEPPPIAHQSITAGVFREISLQGKFSDPDGDTLTYTAATSRPTIATASVNASDNTLTLAALSTGTATITVTAADRPSGQAGRLTAEQTFTVTVELLTPAKVIGLTGEPGTDHGEIELSWAAADDATGYQVQQKESGTSVWTVLPSGSFGIAINGTAAVVSNLDPDKTYDYQVRATNSQGEGEWSVAITAIAVRDERPDKPRIKKAEPTKIGRRGIELEWHRVAGALNYKVVVTPKPSALNIVKFDVLALVTGLVPGTEYDFQVLACNPCGDSPLYSLPSDPERRTGPVPKHWWGHQADHTVQYVVGDIGNSIIEDAIALAVSDWNLKMVSLDNGLRICSGCGASNADGFTTTIKTVDNMNASTEEFPNDNLDEGCGAYFVCVKRASPPGPPSSSGVHVGEHIGNTFIIFEDPPISAAQNVNMVWMFKRWEWTKVSGDHGKSVDEDEDDDFEYLYIGGYMRHELGHVLGLHDYHLDDYMDHLSAVMNGSFEVKPEDIAQLKAIYLYHISH